MPLKITTFNVKLNDFIFNNNIAFFQIDGRIINSEESFTPLQEECLKELNIENDKLMIANYNNLVICPETHSNYNKFVTCFWKKTGRQNENGEVNYETVKSFIKNAIIQALGDDAAAIKFAEDSSTTIVNACKNIKDKSPEEIAVKVRNCVSSGLTAL